MHILLADDDETMRELLEAVLAAAGHSVTGFAEGAALWEAFRRAELGPDALRVSA